MPYPNEHSCRLREPDDFQEDGWARIKRKHEGKEYSVIMGKLKGEDELTEQAYRYAKDVWTEKEARAHCKEHDGILFEPASDDERSGGGCDEHAHPKVESRSFPLPEMRVAGEGRARRIEGYAALFNVLSSDIWNFRERIRSGAFAKTIQEGDIRALWNHDSNYVLGRTKAGTLQLEEDEKGLRFVIQPPEAQWARDLMVSIERGDVNQMSFSFEAVRDEWMTENDQTIRTLVEVKLYDISPVTYPAYDQTYVQLRSLFGAKGKEVVEALGRLEAGGATDADRSLLEGAMKEVSERLTAAPAEGGHPAGEGDELLVQAHLDSLRRRLELARRKP